MEKRMLSSESLAAAITKSASKQTYYTIRLLVDRNRVGAAYQAYGYFRWVDDLLDAETGSREEKLAFVERQKALLSACYQNQLLPNDLAVEEGMLVDLVQKDNEINSGLHTYLVCMMEVMAFDANRRGQFISKAELHEYSHLLAKAVTEALYYFIGHETPPPFHATRYAAVTGAHITHMLRDAIEDGHNGYCNIPFEYLQAREITAQAVTSPAYREWTCKRVQLARRYFQQGKEATARVRNLRCRLAGYAYTARFEWMLRTIERENYCLRAEYPERKSLPAGLWMGWITLSSFLTSFLARNTSPRLAPQPVRTQKQ